MIQTESTDKHHGNSFLAARSIDGKKRLENAEEMDKWNFGLLPSIESDGDDSRKADGANVLPTISCP